MATKRHLMVLASIVIGVLVWHTGCSRSQKPTIAIVTLVSHPILDSSIHGIKSSLSEHGFGGDAVKFIEVNANGQVDLLNAYAKEVLSNHPDVVVPVSTPVAQAIINEAPPGQAIVYSTVTNPNDVGMAKSPQNVTGVSDAVNYGANLDLIRELFPRARVVGIIYNAGERNSQFGVDRVKEIAAAKGLELRIVSVGQPNEVADAARSLVGSVDVFYVGSDNTVVSAISALVGIAGERRRPVVASDIGSVEGGALAAVSVDYNLLGRKVGEIVAQILREKISPGRIKNVMFHGDSLVLNEKTAAQLGIHFNDAIVKRATRVIR